MPDARLMNPIEDIYYNKTTKYTSKWTNYFDIYHTWLQKFINQKPTVLEIGVDNGGSLQMWHIYFGNASLFGVDNRPKFDFNNPIEYLGFDAALIVGDQGDKDFWETFKTVTPKLDVVIDDGSHFQDHQILTLSKLWPIMNEGGIYLVEDTHASYMSIFGGRLGAQTTFISAMVECINGLHVDHFDPEEQKWIEELNKEPFRSIKAIHFYDSVVVLEKGSRPKNLVTYSHREIAI